MVVTFIYQERDSTGAENFNLMLTYIFSELYKKCVNRYPV